jgi:hypothetical protein
LPRPSRARPGPARPIPSQPSSTAYTKQPQAVQELIRRLPDNIGYTFE